MLITSQERVEVAKFFTEKDYCSEFIDKEVIVSLLNELIRDETPTEYYDYVIENSDRRFNMYFRGEHIEWKNVPKPVKDVLLKKKSITLIQNNSVFVPVA
jgi:hypothetical protein